MKPLILDYAVSRKGDTDVLYEYDYKESINTITIDGNKIAFIDTNSDQLSLLTQTKVRKESDDHNFALELGTKTEAARERDDYHHSLLELQTKTFVKAERDDEGFGNYQ
jgi:hypothetical protein